MPTNNQPGASVGPIQLHHADGIEEIQIARFGDWKTVAIMVPDWNDHLGPLFASAPQLKAENEALRVAVAEFRDVLYSGIERDAFHEIPVYLSMTRQFNALFDPLTKAKGGDDE